MQASTEATATPKSLPVLTGGLSSRAEKRRALRAEAKAAKRSRIQPQPDPAGNRAKRRAAFRHVHSQSKPVPRKLKASKKKYRRWRRKHDLPITEWHYLNNRLPA